MILFQMRKSIKKDFNLVTEPLLAHGFMLGNESAGLMEV